MKKVVYAEEAVLVRQIAYRSVEKGALCKRPC